MEKQYQYSDISRILKRYSFDSKIAVCHSHSRRVINFGNGKDIEKMRDEIYPWELETFLLFSIKATPEYNNQTFSGKNYKKFVQIINSIREFEHPKLEIYNNNNNWIRYFLAMTGLIQFDIQEDKMCKLFRYNYIFNFENKNVSFKNEFVKAFGVAYDDFLVFGYFFLVLLSFDLDLKEVVNYIAFKKFPKVTSNLTITLEEYKNELNSISSNESDYISCLRPSYKYAFIFNDGQLYFPLPHLMVRNVTSSLLYRLTDNNNELRSKLGKDVLESYLYDILNESKLFDEIYPEQTILIERHNKFRTLDILAKEKNDYIFFDSKSSVPSMNMRIAGEESFNKELRIYTKHIVQVYKHLIEHFPKYSSYNIFKGSPSITLENLWGVVVVLEDNYIMRDIVYEQAAKELSIQTDSDEYKWLSTHIKIVSFHDIEKFVFRGISLIDSFKKQILNGNPGDYSLQLHDKKIPEFVNDKFIGFRDKLSKDCMNLVGELVENGIISNPKR